MTEPVILAPEDEAGLRAVSSHEAGHALVAGALNADPRVSIAGPSCGACVHGPLTPFGAAAVAIAGPMAEDLLGARSKFRTLPKARLTGESLTAWFSELTSRAGLAQLSAEDRHAVSDYGASATACFYAFEILSVRLDALRSAAEHLADRHRERFAASIVRNNPVLDEQEASSFVAVECQRQQARLAERNASKLAEAMRELLPQPAQFPADLGDLAFAIMRRDGLPAQSAIPAKLAATIESLLAYGENLKRRGGHADFEHVVFATPGEWEFSMRDFLRWRNEHDDHNKT